MRIGQWLLLGLAFFGCAGDDADSYLLEQSEFGVTLSRVAPLSAVPAWELETLWEVSSEFWIDPQQTSISDGLVIVVDPRATQVHVLQLASGAPLASFGRRGEGPGEWRQLVNAAPSGDTILVTTSALQGVRLYSSTGDDLGVFDTEVASLRLRSAPQGRVLGTLPASPPRTFVLTPASGSIREVALPARDEKYSTEAYGDCRHLVATATGFVRLTCSAGRLEFIDSLGNATSWLEWQRAPEQATEGELDAYVVRFYSVRSGGRPLTPLVERQLAGVRDDARIRPVYSELVVDTRNGALLVVEQLFGDYGTTPAVLHLLESDGRHSGLIQTNLFIRDAAIRGDTLALLIRDAETDVVRLRVVRVVGRD